MTVIDHDHHHHHGAGALGSGAIPPPPPPPAAATSWIRRALTSPWRVALLAVAAVLVVDAGGTDEGAGVCVFRRCTGGYCPGCGMTRSARHLTRGEITAAWNDHPFMVLLAVQGLVAAALYVTARRLRERLFSLRSLVLVASANGVLLLSIWVIRLIDGSIPRFF